jgi:hypothetical protein
MSEDAKQVPKEKVINISISYQEGDGGLKHSIKHKIETYKPIHEVMQSLKHFDEEITGRVSLL